MYVRFYRTCEKHTEHMDQLDNELEQQMQRMETRIRKEVGQITDRQCVRKAMHVQ